MARRVSIALLMVVLALLMRIPAAAAHGFVREGTFSNSKNSYGFLIYDTQIAYNKEILQYLNYDEIYSGSAIYIPIAKEDKDTGAISEATAKDIKADNLDVIYKSSSGSRHITDVSVVEGKKEKLDGLDSGVYAKVQLAESYPSIDPLTVDFKLVISINNISYQETEVEFAGRFINRSVIIDDNSVYAARIPTMFEGDWEYDGEATFDMGNGVRYTSKVSRRQKYIIDFTTQTNPDVGDMYPDAYLQFYNFRGDNDTFAAVGLLEIPVDRNKFKDEDDKPVVYAYRVNNGSLTAIDSIAATFESKTGILTIQTQTLGEYVLSNQKLLREVDVQEDNTFQTGYAESDYEEPATEAVPANPPTGGDDTAIADHPPGATPVNPVTGGTGIIRAVNVSAINPPTGPPPSAPAILLAFAAALVASRRLASGGLGGFLKKSP